MSTLREKALSIVSQHKGVWEAPPKKVPTNCFSDAPLLGNGDVGVVIGGNADHMTFYFGKNEFFSRSEGIPKAVASVSLSLNAFADCSYHMEQHLLHGEAISCHEKVGSVLHLHSWMQATDASENLFFLKMKNEGVAPLTGSVSCSGGADNSITGALAWENDLLWMDVRTDIMDKLEGYDTPRARLALRMLDAEAVSVRDCVLSFTIAPNSTCCLAVSLMSVYDSPDYQAAAIRNIREMTTQKAEDLYAGHCRWWEDFWSRSYVEIPQKDIQQHFYGSLYLLACCLREGEHSPTIYGNWVMQDLLWTGTAPLNYNYEAPYYCTIPTNHVDLSENYEKLLFDWMPIARQNAAKIGCSGLYYEAYPGPLPYGAVFSATRWTGLDASGRTCFMGQRSNGLHAATNMILRYYYTRDEAYAQKVLPFLMELADFWLDYLTWDGTRYVSENDYVHEGPENVFPQHNPILTLGFLRLLFQGLEKICQDLSLNPEKRPLWKDRLEHLSALPTFECNGRTIYRNEEFGTSREWTCANGYADEDFSVWSTPCAIPMSATLYPGGQVGPFSPPEELEIARNTVNHQAKWMDGNQTCFYYPSAVRVLHDPREILSRLSDLLAQRAYPNMAINFMGGGLENLNTVPATLVEMLCQSYQNKLWVFADWDPQWDASFGNLMAYGGFLVSAEHRDGKVQQLSVESCKGRTLTLINPWPGFQVQVSPKNGPALILEGAELILETKAGETYRFAPV